MERTKLLLYPLLHSNDPPSPGETSTITKTIDTLIQKLDTIDSRIAHLKSELAQLETTKSTLRLEVEKYSATLSPVRRLPPEVIRIFMLNCFDEDGFDQDQVKNLSLISRQWYQIAISTPRLWSSYTIDTEDEGSDTDSDMGTMAAVIHKASTHLSKASPLPLHLRYMVNSRTPNNITILDYIHSLSRHIRVLHVGLTSDPQKTYHEIGPEFRTTLTQLFRPPTVWPVLYSLSLVMHTDQGYPDDYLTDVFPSPAQSFPTLEAAALDIVGGPLSPRAVRPLQNWRMPWVQLSRLFIGPCAVRRPTDIINILRGCTNLEECYIDMSGYIDSHSGIHSSGTHITLSKVTTFTLKTEDEWMSAAILNHLTLPSLRRYRHDLLKGYDFEIPNLEDPNLSESPVWEAVNAILHPLIEFFSRSSCSETLESLELNLATGLKALVYIWDNVRELFEQVPRLKRFSVSGRDCLPEALLEEIPNSVNDLDVEVSFPQVGKSQRDFVDCVYRQCQELRAANNGVPQEVKAKFKAAKSKSERYAESVMRTFKEGKHESAAKLAVEMG